MFKGWEHACECTKCKGLTFVDSNAPDITPIEVEADEKQTKKEAAEAAKQLEKQIVEIKKVAKSSYEASLNIALAMEESHKSKCCGAPYMYVGLRPKKEHILTTPVLDEPETEIEIEEKQTTVGSYGTVETFTPRPVEKIVEVEEVEEIQEKEQQDNSDFVLEDIVNVHRRMSGRYMTDVVRGVLEENNEHTKFKLNILKAEYPSFFQDALKYVPKFLKSKYDLA